MAAGGAVTGRICRHRLCPMPMTTASSVCLLDIEANEATAVDPAQEAETATTQLHSVDCCCTLCGRPGLWLVLFLRTLYVDLEWVFSLLRLFAHIAEIMCGVLLQQLH